MSDGIHDVFKATLAAVENSSNCLFPFLDEAERKELSIKLSSCVESICEADFIAKAQTEALDIIESTEVEVDDMETAYDDELSKLQLKIKPKSHPTYKQFAATQRNMMKTTNVTDTDDDDLVAGDNEQILLDPLTKKPLVLPVRHTKCGHLYEKSTVEEYIKLRHNRAKCPVVGCKYKGFITKADLKIDEKIIEQINQSGNNQ